MAKSRVTGKESLKQRIREALRSVFTKYHAPRKQVLAEARRLFPKVKVNGEEARQPNVRYQCAECLELYKATEIAVDHKEPVGATPEWPVENEGDWERWMLKLYCDANNLQILCTVCHRRKTNGELRATAENRRNGATVKKRSTKCAKVAGRKLGPR